MELGNREKNINLIIVFKEKSRLVLYSVTLSVDTASLFESLFIKKQKCSLKDATRTAFPFINFFTKVEGK